MPITLQYIAGLFDGEGCIGVYRNGKKTPHLRTQLTQNKNAVVTKMFESLVDRFGGHFSEQKTTHGVKYNWQLSSHKAARFLADILPYLILKKEQAKIAVWWQMVRPERQERDARGRVRPYPMEVIQTDGMVELALKLLKKTSFEELRQGDLGNEFILLDSVLARPRSSADPERRSPTPQVARSNRAEDTNSAPVA